MVCFDFSIKIRRVRIKIKGYSVGRWKIITDLVIWLNVHINIWFRFIIQADLCNIMFYDWHLILLKAGEDINLEPRASQLKLGQVLEEEY